MANQIIIDIGAAANDGTGDPLRTAFNYVNNNFSNVWNTGLPTSNVSFSGNRILTINTNGNLVLAPNGVGKVVANVDIVPNINSAHSLGAIDRRWNTVYTQFLNVNSDVSFAGDVTVAGNLTVEGDTIQIGNIVTDTKTIQLSNTAVTANSANGSGITVGASDNIATFLYNSSSNTWVTNVGIITPSVGNIALVAANIQLSNGAPDTNIYVAPSGTTANAYIRIPTNNTSLANGLAVVNRYGRVEIQAKDGANAQTWYFREDGSFELPGDVDAHIKSDSDILIQTGSGDHWTFGVDNVLTVPGNIVPDTSNAYSLGNATNQWKDLWVSNATIYMNSVPISLTTGNVLTVNGEDVVVTSGDGQSTIGNLEIRGTMISIAGDAIFTETQISISPDVESLAYLQIPNNATADTADVRLHNDAGNVEIGTGSGTYNWYFNNAGNLILPENGNINSADGWTARFQTTDEGEVRAGITLSPGFGLTRLESFDNQNSNGYGTSDWATGEYVNNGGSGEIVFTDAPTIISFFSTIDTSRVFYQVNGGNLLPSAGWGTGGNNITFYTAIPPATSPETVTNFTIYYSNRSVIEMDYDEGELNILSRGLDINIESDQSVDIITNDIIRLQNSGNSSGVAIITDSGNAFHTWNFQPTGNLSLPSQGNIVGTTPNNSGHLQWIGNSSGDGFGYTTLELVPDDTVGSSQRIVIDPTAPGHIHIRAGGTQDDSGADLILGGENSHVKVAAGPNPPVYVSANNQSWTFTTDGVFQAPGDISTAGNIIGNTAGYSIGYRDIPQVAFTGNATISAADAGKHFYSTESTDYILTIADNGNVAWPVGTAITVVNRGTGNITVAQGTGVSLYLAGNATAGNRSVATYGMATLLNVAGNVWMINGTGVS